MLYIVTSWKTSKMRLLVGLILLVIYVGYIVLGGVTFHYLEKDNETRDAKRMAEVRESWVGNRTCVTEKELGDLLERIIDAYEQGIITKRGEPKETDDESWSLHKSIYFATTLVTTIGYGNIAPVTTWGRVVCVIFAIIGIPFALVVFGQVGIQIDSLLGRVVGRCFQDKHTRKAKITRSVINVAGGTTIFILLPSLGFDSQEDWGYGIACYYSFITLTTIGLGDYVAGFDDKQKRYYHILVSVWIVIGLAWMSSLVSNAHDIYNTNIEEAFEKRTNSRKSSGSKRYEIENEQNTKQLGEVDNGHVSSKNSSSLGHIDDSCTIGATKYVPEDLEQSEHL